MRLQEVGRFVAANDYDATTRSMRELAVGRRRRSRFLHPPGESARLFRLGRVARRVDGSAPARAILAVLGPDQGRRQGPECRRHAGRRKAGGRSGGPCAHLARFDRRARPRPCMRRDGSGSPAFGAAAAWRNCSTISFDCSGPTTVQLVGGSGPEDLDLGAFRAGDAVIVIGFAPYSTASVLSARAAHRARRRR